MNSADSMLSQDNIDKVVFKGKRNIKYDGESIIDCLWVELQIFPFVDKINKLQGKNGSMYVPITGHKQKITWVKRIFVYLHGTWKDNIRSVILDWRQRSARETHWPLKQRERSAGHSSERGRSACLSSRPVFSPCVFSSRRRTTSQKGSPAIEERYVRTLSLSLSLSLSLWLYSYYTQSSTLKNKNTNYIFIHLRVLRCLVSGAIYFTLSKYCLLRIIS